MENSQRVQHSGSDTGTPTPENVPEHKPEKIVISKRNSALELFLRLVAYHPWLLVIALLGLFTGGAVLSVYSLGYAGRLEDSHSSNTTEQEKVEIVQPIPSPTVEKSTPFPLWVVIAIALSCGGGCSVIFRWLNNSKPSQKKQKRVNRYEERLAQRRYYQTEPQAPKKPPVFVPPKTSTHSPPTIRKTKTAVTILPPQSNALVIQQEPLVQQVEARKQTSISFVVRK